MEISSRLFKQIDKTAESTERLRAPALKTGNGKNIVDQLFAVDSIAHEQPIKTCPPAGFGEVRYSLLDALFPG